METGIAGNQSLSEGWVAFIILSIAVLLVVLIIYIVKRPGTFKPFASRAKALKTVLISDQKDRKGIQQFNNMLKNVGYAYDAKQDIFYSNMDAWQRQVGYCRLYDEAAAPMGMIIDCEPIYFEYGGKRWMIEFWKGQYDMAAGCEVGVYNTDRPDITLPGYFSFTFYDCAENDDRLHIAYTAKKNGKPFFKREGVHWWLTGFVVGTFCNPAQITMDIRVTLKDKQMCDRFVEALEQAGYSGSAIYRKNNTVQWTFDRPKTKQPYTRSGQTDRIVQAKNKLLCDKYTEAIKGLKTMPERIAVLQQRYPSIYANLLEIGKSKAVFDAYSAIRPYLG